MMTSTRQVSLAHAAYQGEYALYIQTLRANTAKHSEDPLSPSFGVPHEDLAIAPSPPTGFFALHPAAVEAARELKAAHDARVAIGQPGYIPGAEPTEPPRTAPIVNRTQSRDSASSRDSRLGGPFLSALRRAFSRD